MAPPTTCKNCEFVKSLNLSAGLGMKGGGGGKAKKGGGGQCQVRWGGEAVQNGGK